MSPDGPVAAAYRALARVRTGMFIAVGGLVLLAGFSFSRVTLEEDVAAMLPDDRSDAARDFDLLRQAPSARKVIIRLWSDAGTDRAVLPEAADRLAGSLSPPHFSRALTGPPAAAAALPGILLRALPGLFTEEDRAAVEAVVKPESVRARLEDGYARLLSPEGLAYKELFRADPLGLWIVARSKLRSLNLVGGLGLRDNHFMSRDGAAALILADTPVAMTDSKGSRELLARFTEASGALPKGVRAELVSGHRYTVANADAIIRDLTLILSISSLAILGIYLAFLRSRWAFFVFLVPASVLVIASGTVSLLYPAVFAVTIGFGGVLLGMADEYAMHVFFALRADRGDPAGAVNEVARPVIFGGLATAAAFGVMLTSRLPGQRQLAVFSVIGIAVSVLLSLMVLPHLIRPGGRVSGRAPDPERPRGNASRWILVPWLILLAVCAWQAAFVRFDGDLGSMNMVPADLREAERRLRDSFGDPRGKALLFAEGRDLDEALQRNEQAFALVSKRLPGGDLVSLAPLLPAAATREANRRRWEAFWGHGRAEELKRVLEREGARLGFASNAFSLFLSSLTAPLADIGPGELRAAGLGDLIDSLIVSGRSSVKVQSLLPDVAEAAALFPPASADAGGVRFVSQSRFRESVSRAIAGEFLRYLLLTSLVILVIVILAFREPKKVLLSLVPVVTGMLFMTGFMGFSGIPFNLFNIVATVLIIGLCVDYGIFMVCHVYGETDHAAGRAVLVSGLTTIAGFGVLVLARHPAMHSIGLSVLLGFGAAIPSALWIIPALAGGDRR